MGTLVLFMLIGGIWALVVLFNRLKDLQQRHYNLYERLRRLEMAARDGEALEAEPADTAPERAPAREPTAEPPPPRRSWRPQLAGRSFPAKSTEPPKTTPPPRPTPVPPAAPVPPPKPTPARPPTPRKVAPVPGAEGPTAPSAPAGPPPFTAPPPATPPRPTVPTPTAAATSRPSQPAVAAGARSQPQPAKPPPPTPPRDRDAHTPRRPDLEILIGTGWLSRIGMVAVLLAMAYFLKYALDAGWISPGLRVVMGCLAGIGAMIGGELTHRKGYGVQSQVLTGGGAGLLYLTLFAGLHLYHLPALGSTVTFAAMAIVTALTAAQALRHRSETVAVFAWVAGYAVPALIGGEGQVASGPSSNLIPLFLYLLLLTAGVLAVARRHAWPAFTGLALLGAYSGGAYLFRTSAGSMGWTLTYLMLVTGGMLWLATLRRPGGGERFGAIGAVAGYAVTAATMLSTGAADSLAVPYVYLLILSGAVMWLGHMYGWRTLQWCGLLGAFVGFLLLRHLGVAQLGNWLFVYAAVSVAGAAAACVGRSEGAEPLALAAISTAYATAAALAWQGQAQAVTQDAMYVYLVALMGAVVGLTWRFDWPKFSIVGLLGAFFGTLLLTYDETGGGFVYYPLIYLVLVTVGGLAMAIRRDAGRMGTIAVVGSLLALPLTGLMGLDRAGYAVPLYLAFVALVGTGATERMKWYGLERFTVPGVWVMYVLWRQFAGPDTPTAIALLLPTAYLLTFLAGMWVRHGVLRQVAFRADAVLAGLNAFTYFLVGWSELRAASLGAVEAPGLLALGLFGLYAWVSVEAIQRRPRETWFGPALGAFAAVFLTVAIALLFQGYTITMLWALQATLMMALGFRVHSRALRNGALVALGLAFVRALMVDSAISPDTYHVLANSRALSMLSVIAGLYVSAYLYAVHRGILSEEEDTHGTALSTLSTVLLWWICSAETWTYMGWQAKASLAAQHFALSGVWLAFGAALMAVGTVKRLAAARWCALALWAATVLKVALFDPALASETYRMLLNPHGGILLATAALLYVTSLWHRSTGRFDLQERSAATVLALAGNGLLLWGLSIEVWYAAGWEYGAALPGQQFALSIAWLLVGTAFVALGIARDWYAFRWCAMGVWVLTVGKVLTMDPALTPASYALVVNPHGLPLITIALLAYATAAWYAKAKKGTSHEAYVGAGLSCSATALLLGASSMEAWLYLGWQVGAGPAMQHAGLSAVWIAFASVFIIVGIAHRWLTLRWTGFLLYAITVAKVLAIDPELLEGTYRVVLNPQALPLLVVVGALYAWWAWHLRRPEMVDAGEAGVLRAMPVIASALLWWVLSVEAWHTVGWLMHRVGDPQQYALSAVWSALGAALIAVGLTAGSSALRWTAMTLFAVTVIKVFTLDMSGLDLPYRILALLGLGAVLIGASFGYQRLVKDDDSPAPLPGPD